MTHKIPKFMLRQDDIKLISFCKNLSKIKDSEKEIEYLVFIMVNFDQSVFGKAHLVDNFVKKNLDLLVSLEDYFDYKELFVIKKNFEYIKSHPYIFPKLMKTKKPNLHYFNKYGKEIYFLYLSNYERTALANKILEELETKKFSINTIESIKDNYGIKSNNDLFEILHQVIYRDDLEALMVSCEIKPYTENFPMTKNKSYVFSWKIRNLIKKIPYLEKKEVEEIIRKIIEERSKNIDKKLSYYTDFIKQRMYKLAYYILNKEEYQLFEEKVTPYFYQKDQEKLEKKREYNKAKVEEEKKDLIQSSMIFIDDYIKNGNIEEDVLVKNLAIIKKYNKDLYDEYIKKIYGEKAEDYILMFIKSNAKSLNDFLFQENISFFTFNKYRLLINSKLSDELKEKLRQDSIIAYNNIKNTVELLLKNDDNDYAYISMILHQNKINEKTIISFVENAVKKEQIHPIKYNKLKKITKNLRYYSDNRLKYNYGTTLFNNSVSSLKEYNGVEFTDNLKNQAIKYLFDCNCDVNYFTVRSLLIRYASSKSFEMVKNK